MDLNEKVFAEFLTQLGKTIFANDKKVSVTLLETGDKSAEFVLKFDPADFQGTDEYVSRVTRAIRLLGAMAFRKSLESSGKRYTIGFEPQT
jgi:hypothetical protein